MLVVSYRLDVDFTSPRVVVSADIIAAMLDFADRTMVITQAAMNGMPKRAQGLPVTAAHVDAEEAIPLVAQTRLQVECMLALFLSSFTLSRSNYANLTPITLLCAGVP
jgi:DNA polymerase III psi subunit